MENIFHKYFPYFPFSHDKRSIILHVHIKEWERSNFVFRCVGERNQIASHIFLTCLSLWSCFVIASLLRFWLLESSESFESACLELAEPKQPMAENGVHQQADDVLSGDVSGESWVPLASPLLHRWASIAKNCQSAFLFPFLLCKLILRCVDDVISLARFFIASSKTSLARLDYRELTSGCNVDLLICVNSRNRLLSFVDFLNSQFDNIIILQWIWRVSDNKTIQNMMRDENFFRSIIGILCWYLKISGNESINTKLSQKYI